MYALSTPETWRGSYIPVFVLVSDRAVTTYSCRQAGSDKLGVKNPPSQPRSYRQVPRNGCQRWFMTVGPIFVNGSDNKSVFRAPFKKGKLATKPRF